MHIFTGEIGIILWLSVCGFFSEEFLVNDIEINKLGPNMDLNQIPFIGILICLLL